MTRYELKNVASLPDPKADPAVLVGIPGWRRRHILSYLRPQDRKLSLGAWRLLERMLKQHGISALDVTAGANGKPACAGICFNLSHCADLVLCAVSDVPVGCDIEKITDAPMEIAERYFSENERRYLSGAGDSSERNHRFFKLWTIRESYLKMTGEGMGLPLERIAVEPDTYTLWRDRAAQPCVVQSFTQGGYAVSICTAARGRART